MNNLEFLVKNYQTPPEAISLVENSRVLLLAGISGAGKDTTKKYLLKNPEYRDIVSHTTRAPRENNGWHFYGFSKKYFESLKISRKDILKIKESDLRAELLTKIDKKLEKM